MTAPRKPRTRVVPAAVELPDLGEADAGTPEPEPAPDLDAILSDPTTLTVVGIPVTVRRLATREIMAGIRILVNEMGAGITELDLKTLMAKPDEDDEEALAKLEQAKASLMGFLLVATPNAADEILKLLASLVEIKNPDQNPTLAKTLKQIMENPPPSVALDVVGVVFAQERDDFTALVGKARPLLEYAQALARTGKQGT